MNKRRRRLQQGRVESRYKLEILNRLAWKELTALAAEEEVFKVGMDREAVTQALLGVSNV